MALTDTTSITAGLPDERASWSAAKARAAFRNGLVVPTSGFAYRYAQANLIIVPKAIAFDALLFAQHLISVARASWVNCGDSLGILTVAGAQLSRRN